MRRKEMSNTEFGQFGQGALQKKFGGKDSTAYKAHMSKIQKERWAKRRRLKTPTITEGGGK